MSVNEENESFTRYIRCPDCGEQIMMVPVLSEMIEIIENHIATHEHLNQNINLPLPRPKAPVLREDLTEQVLLKAAETTETPNKNSLWIKLE